jgi:hypothetical protein
MCHVRSTAARGDSAYLAESVDKVILQNSIPAQIHQLEISNNTGQVDGFVRDLTFAKRHYKHFL